MEPTACPQCQRLRDELLCTKVHARADRNELLRLLGAAAAAHGGEFTVPDWDPGQWGAEMNVMLVHNRLTHNTTIICKRVRDTPAPDSPRVEASDRQGTETPARVP